MKLSAFMNITPLVDSLHLSTGYDDVERSFASDPAATVNDLIAANALKGNRLSCLRKRVLANISDPQTAEWLWLVLSPRLLSIMVTQDKCNLACRMCGGSKGVLKYLESASYERILQHIPTAELVTCVAGNSEPLLSPALPDLLRAASAAKVNLDIVTNGHLLSDDLIRLMLETKRPTGLNISIDAAKNDTYRNIRGASLDHLLENLHRLKDQKLARASDCPTLSLLMVGMADNIVELPDLVLLARELNASRVHVDHLKGDFHPGDFTLNPEWRRFVLEAQELAESINIALQLPADVGAWLHSNQENKCPSASPAKKISCASPMWNYCSWMDSVQIDLACSMSPCCHNSRQLGNILEKHISQQTDYLRYRIKNLDGRVESFCLGAKNCAYIEERRACGMVPDVFV